MTLALLQPVFAPNLYDMAVMLQSDRVILDDIETWSRKGRVHRALIRTPGGTSYIHIPVRTQDRNKPIKEVRIDQESDWITPVLRTLQFNYRNSLYFDYYEAEIDADFNEGKEYDYLLPFVLYLRKRLFRYLELDLVQKESLASECRKFNHNPDSFALDMGADRLFQEHDSRHYQRQADMRSEPDFSHPEYRQHFEGFIPWCCLYDLLFQYGPESFKVIDQLH
jgi:hypothetical protein